MISKNAIQLLKTRYCREGENPEDVYKRTAKALSGGDSAFEDILYNLMLHKYFLPNSPALFNSGFANMMHACCALGIEDNMESIANFQYTLMMMFKYGAGVGVNYSKLRSKDSSLSGGGTSSGILSLMKVTEANTEYVKQGGYRRGANMSLLWYHHPEIIDFVQSKLKGHFPNMNLSVMVDNYFMDRVSTDEYFEMKDPHTLKVTNKLKYKDFFDILTACAWSCGCPGLVFFDRINQDNKFYPEVIIDTTNPCAESPIPVNSLCCLGSINLSKLVKGNEFNFDKFREVLSNATKALLNMNRIGWYPFDYMKEAMDKFKPIGTGIMGFADALIKLGIYYDSQDCLDFIDTIGKVYKEVTDSVAEDSFYRRIVAPTGSLSILADCSSGVEPIFSEVFERHLTVGKIEETREIYKSQYVRAAHEITPEWHVNIQAQWQKWVDGGISKTINLPYSASIDDVKHAYIQAYKLGCKGITVYRDMSKNEQVLYAKHGCEGETCYL
jgi:ribonucleoside-diphosphate reductase alpha chain